jgi:dienelactone hydrolase
VVFAHGWAVPPEFFAELLVRWAAAGYVVAAPAYPLLSGIPAGPSHADYVMSFADTTFVLTQLLQTFGAPAGSHPLAGLIDPERIAAAGHSDGQAIAYGVGFLVCCRDPRVKAVVAMAGDLGNINNPVQRDNGVPILHVVSERDEFNGYTSTLRWDREVLTAPKWSVTLVGAPHTPPFVDPASRYFEGVVAMTVDFLDAMLKGRPERVDRIVALAGAQPDLYRMNE